jgi:hypothetical protein
MPKDREKSRTGLPFRGQSVLRPSIRNDAFSFRGRADFEKASAWLLANGIEISVRQLDELFGPQPFRAPYGQEGQKLLELRQILQELGTDVREAIDPKAKLDRLRQMFPASARPDKPSEYKNIESETRSQVRSKAKISTSEGFIERKDSQSVATSLPDTAPALWPGRQRGRPLPTSKNLLLEFLATTYGPYFPKFRSELRVFIHRHDPALYQAIVTYERNNELPAALAMPTQQDIVRERFKKAVKAGYDTLSSKEKASVRKKLWRSAKLNIKD